MKVWNFDRNKETINKKELLEGLIGKNIEIGFEENTNKDYGSMNWTQCAILKDVKDGKIELDCGDFKNIEISKIYRIKEL